MIERRKNIEELKVKNDTEWSVRKKNRRKEGGENTRPRIEDRIRKKREKNNRMKIEKYKTTCMKKKKKETEQDEKKEILRPRGEQTVEQNEKKHKTTYWILDFKKRKIGKGRYKKRKNTKPRVEKKKTKKPVEPREVEEVQNHVLEETD